jgi:hypothetical protein
MSKLLTPQSRFSLGRIVITGTTATRSSGGVIRGDEDQDARSWNESNADSGGDSSTWTESESESESESSVLIPVMGKELAHVQFRSLEEQLFRAMAVLFDQKQRHGVVRMVGMSAPVSIVTPEVYPMPTTPERKKRFLDRHYAKLPFAQLSAAAHKVISDREQQFSAGLLLDTGEPTTTKREIVGNADEPAKVKRRLQ